MTKAFQDDGVKMYDVRLDWKALEIDSGLFV